MAGSPVDWKKQTSLIFMDSSVPARHRDTTFKLFHDALPTRQNIARWGRRGRFNANCATCGNPETSVHVFQCLVNRALVSEILAIVSAIPSGAFELAKFPFVAPKHPLARSLLLETIHQLWRRRCDFALENIAYSDNVVKKRIIKNMERTITVAEKPSLYDTTVAKFDQGSFTITG